MFNSGKEPACWLNEVRLIFEGGSEIGFTRFSRALVRWPRVPPAFVCPAMCPSVARSRDGNKLVPAAST